MISKFGYFLRRTSNLSGMRIWKRSSPMPPIKLSSCITVLSYFKQTADIPRSQSIWDREAIDALIKRMKIRKLRFFTAFGTTVIFAILTAILFLIGIACAVSGNECSSTIPKEYYGELIIFSAITVGLLLWKRSIARNHFKTDFQDFYHSGLTSEQKRALTREILKLKDNLSPVYEVGNYEELNTVDSMIWTAENWFLVLTENEKDRVGVWLDGRVPLGQLMIQYNFKNHSQAETNLVWDKLQLAGFKFLVSDIDRLRSFIQSKKKTPLKRNQPFWVEGFEKLEQVYSDYPRYLAGEMSPPELKKFENLFSPIFAQISKNKSKHEQDADLHDIGYSGAKNFLRGRITSLEKWINSP